MRWAMAMLCAWVVTVEAAPPAQKSASEAYPYKALKWFAEGVVAERDGDLDHAIRAFEAANRASPQAPTFFNLGRLHLEQEDLEEAIRAFEKYLELLPKAADRPAVEALLQSIRTTVWPVSIGGYLQSKEGADAILLVDGAMIGRSPMVVKLAPGQHQIERVTRVSYADSQIDVVPGKRQHVQLNGDRDTEGNVVITGLGRGSGWTEGGVRYARHDLFALPIGRHRTMADGLVCSPLEIVVKSKTAITHVRVELAKEKPGEKCQVIERVHTQTLQPRAR